MNFSFAREDYCVCEHVWGLQFAAANQNSTVDSSEVAFSATDIDFLENLANGNAENLPPTPWFEQMKMIVSYGTLIIGLPANILILFITAFNWRTKSSSSWLVLNLAVADLCLVVSAFLTILKASKYNRTIDGDVRFPQLQCKFDFGCPHFFACVSFFSISAIAFDRFYAIVRAGVGDNPGFRYSMIFGTVWTLSLLLTFPMLYFANAIKNNDEYTCIVAWTMQSRDQCVVMGSNKSYN
ncbi:Oidioi.mRNA.OKI2018_I69.chr2.g6388.t1.cds [Oikopleura dioica]|uniref:Oidioi.mRNA.OKI2018_I69.chr2.g6388.t1.cds n=1 Tax=Oikopleura dioica TaxID=34765 RepID=A0ABN7T394_OIKDI|nr:Oidioi.mRNA.OKI2018_I69.chr2.g6388.t1.cds [Oikopleura dioica]